MCFRALNKDLYLLSETLLGAWGFASDAAEAGHGRGGDGLTRSLSHSGHTRTSILSSSLSLN